MFQVLVAYKQEIRKRMNACPPYKNRFSNTYRFR